MLQGEGQGESGCRGVDQPGGAGGTGRVCARGRIASTAATSRTLFLYKRSSKLQTRAVVSRYSPAVRGELSGPPRDSDGGLNWSAGKGERAGSSVAAGGKGLAGPRPEKGCGALQGPGTGTGR